VVRTLKYAFAGIFVLAVTAFLLLQLPPVQNYLGQYVISQLERSIDSEISVDDVQFGFFHVNIDGLTVYDQQQDPLLVAREFRLKYNAFALLRNTIDLRYIHLSGGSIHLKRNRSETDFNYQYLLDALAIDSSETGSSSNMQIKPAVVVLEDFSIAYDDLAGGTSYHQSVVGLRTRVARIDTENNEIHLGYLHINKPKAVLTTTEAFPAEKLDGLITESLDSVAVSATDSILAWNPDGWKIRLDALTIGDGSFSLLNTLGTTGITTGLINWDDLLVDNINLNLQSLLFEGDTLSAKVNHLSLKEQSGFVLDTLHSLFTMAPNRIELDDMVLATPRSHISRQLVLRFSNFDDFNNFEELVTMEADLSNSHLHLADLNYFAEGIPLKEDTYHISGHISGRVNSLRGRDVHLRYGTVTRLDGDFTIYGLPDQDETFMDLNLENLVTNKREIEEMVTMVSLPPQFAQLGTMTFKGTFTGFLHNFVAFGNLQTAIGSLSSDINMDLAPPSGIPTYKGNLHANNFDLGKWFNEPNMGRVTFSGHLEGEGLSLEEINTHFDGRISSFELGGYTYKDALFNGDLTKNFFSGELLIDGNDLTMDFIGTVDFTGEVPEFDIQADVDMARLKPLGLIEEDYRLRTIIDAKFRGTTIDDIVGQINLRQTELYSDRFYNIGTVSLKAEEYELGKRIMLESTLVDAMLDGNFNASELGPTAMSFLSQYYPSVLSYSSAATGDMDFFFSFNVKKSTNLVSVFMPGIKGLAGTSISGNFNSSAQRMIAFATIPEASYGDMMVEGLAVEIRGGVDSLFFDISADNYNMTQNLSTTPHVSGYIAHDNVNFTIELYEDLEMNRFFARANFQNYGDSLALKLLNSDLTIAGQDWYIDEANEIRYFNNNLYFNNIELKSGEQSIVVKSNVNQNNETNLIANFQQVEIANLLSIVQYRDYTITGLLDGEMALDNVMGDISKLDGDITIKNMVMQDVSLGNLATTLDIDIKQGIANIDAALAATNGGNLTAKGYFNYGDNGKLSFRIQTDDTPLKTVEPFIDYLASELEGNINGDVILAGTMNNPSMNGKLTVTNGQALVNYLGSKYYFEPMNVDFTGKSIYVRDTKLKDGPGSNASTANMGGEITFRDFNNMTFEDFYVRTQSNFKFMETTKEQNDLFYGTAYGRGIVLINGPIDDLRVEISAKSDPNTRVFIPIDLSTSVSQYDFIEFIDRNEESITGTIRPSYTGVTLVMDLLVTPDAEVQIIFDEQTGEVIRGNGEGNLQLKVDQSGNFEMYGTFTIHEGDYLFRLQDLASKRFAIERGSTVSWTGDPYDARLNLKAVYSRRIARYDLVADLASQMDATEIRSLKRPVNVDLKMIMTGSLERPDISFEIDVPSQESVVGSYFANRLRQVQTDENELNKQVFGLIVFNKFLPPTIGGDQQVGFNVGNTLTEFIANQINMYFSDWLGNYNMSVNVDYHSYDIGQGEEDMRQQLELELQKRIGRFSFNVGGNLDVGQRANSDNNIYGDFELEYSITEDGRIRIRAFRDTEYNIFEDGYRGKTGVGISLRKEFDSFSDLFSRTEKLKEVPVEPEPDTSPEVKEILEQLKQETTTVPPGNKGRGRK
jgi:hypothetical protein